MSYVRPLAVGALALLIGFQISGWIGFAFAPQMRAHSDFPMYYQAAEIIRSGNGGSLYPPALGRPFPYNHPALEAVVFIPLTVAPLALAYWLWFGINFALVGIAAALFGSMKLPACPLVVLLAFFPVSFAIMNAQDSIVMLLVAIVAFKQIRRDKDLVGGLVLGLTCFRFQFLIPLLAALCLWKRYRIVLGAMLTSVACAALSVLITGVGSIPNYIRLVLDTGRRLDAHTMGNLRALLTGFSLEQFTIAASLLIFVATAWVGRSREKHQQILLAIVLSSLVSYHLYVYDLAMLILPLVVLTEWLLEQGRYRALFVPLAVLIAPSAVLLVGGPTYFWVLGSFTLLLLFTMASCSSLRPTPVE